MTDEDGNEKRLDLSQFISILVSRFVVKFGNVAVETFEGFHRERKSWSLARRKKNMKQLINDFENPFNSQSIFI